MSSPPPATTSALVVDLYELTMMQAYHQQGENGHATFDLFVRRLPPGRDFLLVAGLETMLERLEGLRFAASDLDYLATLGLFEESFLERLKSIRFSGDVMAMREGTLAFAGEPILRVTAPIIEAQFFETMVMNQIHLQTLLASKAARVVLAADGRGLVDFGLRRTHGAEAGLYGARASYIAGFDATSNVLAGRCFGIPVAGTMAHSYIQASGDEVAAFRSFAKSFPETILLVDTYDTLRGVERVIALAEELGNDFRVRGIRLDSGDLGALARAARERLDAAGLERLKIFASGNLDESKVRALVAAGAPIDAFGIGTRLGTSEDAPNLDIVYKLAQLDGRPLLKLSTDKKTLPGMKQVWRKRDASGVPTRDVVGLVEEDLDGEPLLTPVMAAGKRLPADNDDLATARERAAGELRRLPEAMRRLEPVAEPYPVSVSDRLRALRDELASRA
jgi:nicotinate phosphoribosyltransferase